MITQEELRDMFTYDPATGNLIHRRTRQGSKRAGSVAGSPHNAGYIQIQLEGKKYLIHRLVWLYHHGFLPEQLDHINRVRNDNRIENLRVCTFTENHGNSGKQSNNTSGYKGVTWHKRERKWMAQISGDFIGYYDCKHEAAEAYNERARDVFGEFALLNLITPEWLRLK